MLMFSYRGSHVLIKRTLSGETYSPEEICGLIASALTLFLRDSIISYEEFQDSIGFLGTIPSHERLSGYLGDHLTGLIWTEIPE